ncbi:MAG: hypothetical protein AAF432_10045 [Planctomycetota bacterium]
MKNQPKGRLILASIFGIAILILIVDRVMLGGATDSAQQADAAAIADPLAPLTSPVSGPDMVTSTSSRAGYGAGALASRFETHAQVMPVELDNARDIFVASPNWSGLGVGDAELVDPDMAPSPNEMIDRYEVTAIMQQGENSGAIINDEFVRIGQVLDGYRLVEVNARSVIFETGGLRAELILDQ